MRNYESKECERSELTSLSHETFQSKLFLFVINSKKLKRNLDEDIKIFEIDFHLLRRFHFEHPGS